MTIGGTNHWVITALLTNELQQTACPRPPIGGLVLVVIRSDLAAFHDCIDIALRLRLIDAILGDDLGDEIVLVLECTELLLGELAPLGSDIFEKNLLRLSGIASTS